MNAIPKLIEGEFALVGSGNMTQSWMLDGTDVQERANTALGSYYGGFATVHKRGVHGWALHVSGPYMIELYTSQAKAQAHWQRAMLSVVGEVLFGGQWQTDLARALNLSDPRRIRQWIAGERNMPPGIWQDCAALLHKRQADISTVLGALPQPAE